MYFDWMYLALVIPAMIFAIAMQALVSSRYTKYGAVMTKRGITGYQAARMVLDSHGLNMVPIEMIAGDLTDNYLVLTLFGGQHSFADGSGDLLFVPIIFAHLTVAQLDDLISHIFDSVIMKNAQQSQTD